MQVSRCKSKWYCVQSFLSSSSSSSSSLLLLLSLLLVSAWCGGGSDCQWASQWLQDVDAEGRVAGVVQQQQQQAAGLMDTLLSLIPGRKAAVSSEPSDDSIKRTHDFLRSALQSYHRIGQHAWLVLAAMCWLHIFACRLPSSDKIGFDAYADPTRTNLWCALTPDHNMLQCVASWFKTWLEHAHDIWARQHSLSAFFGHGSCCYFEPQHHCISCAGHDGLSQSPGKMCVCMQRAC